MFKPFAWLALCVAALGAAPLRGESGPLPARNMNVMPWAGQEQRGWTRDRDYFSLGWTAENLSGQLRPHELTTIRIAWGIETFDAGDQSKWFADLDAMLAAGFRVVISCHTHQPGTGERFQPYRTRDEADIPVARRNADNAPTWTRFIADWKRIAERYKDDPRVIGYEPFNEYAPVGKPTDATTTAQNASTRPPGPGGIYMRDIGGWLDALRPLSIDVGKPVWIQGLWASTSFAPLEGKRDDAGRSLADHFAAHPGLLFPAVHMYNWYGKGPRRPESVEQVRGYLKDAALPDALRQRLQQIADEADATRQMQLLHQFNFDMRLESTTKLIAEARRACGVGESVQVWMSEAGVGVKSFTGDVRADATTATHFRAIVRACNASNTSICFWLDRGRADAWGFFTNDPAAPIDPARIEYHRAFFDDEAAAIDYLSDPKSMSVLHD